MPPKFKYTKEEIVNAAMALVREGGMDALTARALGERLGTSAKPIFTQFQNMEELETAVLQQATKRYTDILAEEMSSQKYPAYKGSGMGYIRFAREERELFRLLFMREQPKTVPKEQETSFEGILDVIQKQLPLSREDATRFHATLWAWVHGVASMIATGYQDWGDEAVSEMLSDVYMGLKERYQTKTEEKK